MAEDLRYVCYRLKEEMQSHRMAGRDHQAHLVPTPAMGTDTFHQTTLRKAPSNLEHFQEWGNHNFSHHISTNTHAYSQKMHLNKIIHKMIYVDLYNVSARKFFVSFPCLLLFQLYLMARSKCFEDHLPGFYQHG